MLCIPIQKFPLHGYETLEKIIPTGDDSAARVNVPTCRVRKEGCHNQGGGLTTTRTSSSMHPDLFLVFGGLKKRIRMDFFQEKN